MKIETPPLKELIWVGRSKDDLIDLPSPLSSAYGYKLHLIQMGSTPAGVKVLKGFGGRSVLEIKEDFDKDTYRAVYTTKFEDTVFVLHVFQKKSKKGIATPKPDMDMIHKRLKEAELIHIERKKQKESKV